MFAAVRLHQHVMLLQLEASQEAYQSMEVDYLEMQEYVQVSNDYVISVFWP